MDRGALQQVGSPDDLYDRPQNLFVAQFIGEPPMNLLAGRLARRGVQLVLEGDAGVIALPVAPMADLVAAAPADVVVGVRPEHLALAAADAADSALAGTVFFREPRGDTDVVLVRLEPGRTSELAVEVEPAAPWRPGDRVRVTLRESALHVFDPGSGATLAIRG